MAPVTFSSESVRGRRTPRCVAIPGASGGMWCVTIWRAALGPAACQAMPGSRGSIGREGRPSSDGDFRGLRLVGGPSCRLELGEAACLQQAEIRRDRQHPEPLLDVASGGGPVGAVDPRGDVVT